MSKKYLVLGLVSLLLPVSALAEMNYKVYQDCLASWIGKESHQTAQERAADCLAKAEGRDPAAPPAEEAKASEGLPSAGKVKVLSFKPDVTYRHGNGNWEKPTEGMTLSSGDEIAADPDGEAELQLTDGSTIKIMPLTQIHISKVSDPKTVTKTEILLRVGEMAAQVKKSGPIKSDFSIRSPTAVASVRGTFFTVAYDDKTGVSTVAVKDGSVEVTPENGLLKPVTITPGQEVSVSMGSIDTPHPISEASEKIFSRAFTGKSPIITLVIITVIILIISSAYFLKR